MANKPYIEPKYIGKCEGCGLKTFDGDPVIRIKDCVVHDYIECIEKSGLEIDVSMYKAQKFHNCFIDKGYILDIKA